MNPQQTIDEARARAIAKGMSPHRPTAGPIADMLIAGGMPHDDVRRVVHQFTRYLRADLLPVMGQAALDRMDLDCEDAIAADGGDITF